MMYGGAARKILCLTNIGKRTKEGYDRGSKVWVVHIGRARKG